MSRRGKHGSDADLVIVLACGATVENAARKFGVSERTVYRRLKKPEFCQRVTAQRMDMMKRAAGMLTASIMQAAKTLLSLQDESIPPGVRLAAARAIIDKAVQLRQGVEFEERLTRLEQYNPVINNSPVA